MLNKNKSRQFVIKEISCKKELEFKIESLIKNWGIESILYSIIKYLKTSSKTLMDFEITLLNNLEHTLIDYHNRYDDIKE